MKPARILLVEDNPGDLELTIDALADSDLVLDVSSAIDGADALNLLRRLVASGEGLPDLVVLDLNLPKLDGREVLAAIRSTPELRTLPVVVLSSSDAERDVLESYAAGANCYVTKPVDLAGFQSAVRSIGGFWLSVVRLP
ncbi:MAG: response regulator [Deltaproteobacteria bacterium]|nr:response regulator [Deltaproteobacteria bacterium]MBK8235328.1 response regulator [Deltaproteobacteria bacterium]MBK8716351.1 response regulator [Deltaproteobacteria bacterium]MBP7287929.1 response regulator [Nannocystaceae bacterium]